MTAAVRRFVLNGIRVPWRRKPIRAIATLSLDETNPKRPVFSARICTRAFPGDLAPLLRKSNHAANDPVLEEICELSVYVDNDLHPGTRRQEEAVRDAIEQGKLESTALPAACAYLKSIGLYVDDEVRDAAGRPHRYGRGWVYAEIPESDLLRIRYLIDHGDVLPRNT